MNEEFIPKVGMEFSSIAAAKRFYADYAERLGFGVKLYRGNKSKFKWINCVREGKNTERLTQETRKRKKTTKRVGCRAGIKLRKIYCEDRTVERVVIAYVNHNHNHPFLKGPGAAKHFHCNKESDPTYLEYITAMQRSRIHTTTIMDHMADLHGGAHHVPLTEKDLENM